MLQKMRDQAQSLVAKILVGAIIFVLCVFGFGAFSLFAVGERSVADVGGEEIGESVLLTQLERQRRQLMLQMGPEFDPSAIDENRLRRSVLDRLIQRKILLQEAQRQSLAAPSGLVDETIRQIPQFRIEDQFNEELAKRMLSQLLHTPSTFRQELADDIRLRQMSDGVGRTGFITKVELERVAALQRQRRDVAWIVIPAEAYRDQVSLSDDDVEAYYRANLAEYVEPEMVEVDFLELQLSDFTDDAEATEDEIAAEYEAEKRASGGEEERRAAHILLEIRDDRDEQEALGFAGELRQRVLDGEDFGALAEEYSDDAGSASGGGDLGYITRESEFDPDFTEAVFALAPDSVSEPVVTQFGVHLIRVGDVRVRELPSLEELRESLEARVRQRKGEASFVDTRRRMEELAFEQFDSLEGVAEELGLEIRHAGPFSRDQGEGVADDARVRNAAFSDDVLVEGNNSAVVNLGSDRALVLRVTEHAPQREIPLEEIADKVREELRSERAAEMAEATAREAIASLDRGIATDVVAASLGQTWEVVEGASRFHGAVAAEVLSAAFDLPRPVGDGKSVGSTRLPNGDSAIVTVSHVSDGTLEALSAAEREALTRFLEGESARTEFEGFRESLAETTEVDRS